MAVTHNDILRIAIANPDVDVPSEALDALKKKRQKYGNQWCEFDGHKFQSKAEMRRYGELRLLVLTGHITGMVLQPVFDLPGNIKYKADFQYTEDGVTVVEDVKSSATEKNRVFINKWKQVQEIYPDIDWRIVKS